MSDRYPEHRTIAFADCTQTRGIDSRQENLQIVEMDPSGRYIKYYEILGKGAVKTVYRAFDKIDGIEVAWNQAKLEDLLRNPDDLERFYEEVHLLRSLKHKNIIKLYNSWVDTRNRNINFITEIFTSGTLRQYREKHKHVDLKAVKHWARQILRGLLYLHSHDPPIIHRDLKCDNIFINGNVGEVKIGDFGLAVILCQSRAARSVLGTPEFMAPELYEEEYNELIDIYSFGMCLLEMITSEYPYSECTNAAQIYKKVTAGKKPAAMERLKDPSARLFIEKCLEKANKRPSARELLMDPFLLCADRETTECMNSVFQSDKDVDIGGADWEERCYDTTTSAEDSVSPSSDPRANAAVAQGNAILEGCRTGVAVSSFVPSTLDGLCRRLSHDFSGSWEVAGPVDDPFSSSLSSETESSRSNVIMLGLRIVNPAGQIRSIRFPFDVEGDTTLSVASEMVHELNLPDQDVSLIAELIDSEIKAVNPNWKIGPAFDDLMVGVPSLEEEFMEQSKLGAIHKTAKLSPCTSMTSKVPLFDSTKQNSCFSTEDNVALSSTRPECTMHGRFGLFDCTHSLRRTNEPNNFSCRLSENQVRLDLTKETSFTISSNVDNSYSNIDQHEAISSVGVTQKDSKYPKSVAEKSHGYISHTMREVEHSKHTSKSSRIVELDDHVEMPPSEIHDGCCKNFKILTERVHGSDEQLKPVSLHRGMTSSPEDEDASLLFASELKLLGQAFKEELRALQTRHEQALLQLKNRYRHGKSFGSPLSVCSDDHQVNGTMCATLQDSSYLAPLSDSNDAYTSRSEKIFQLGCEAGRQKTSNAEYSNFVEHYRLPVCGTANCQTSMLSEKTTLPAVPGHGSQRKSTSKETGTPWNCSPGFDMIWRELDTFDRHDGLEQGNRRSQVDESIASVGLVVGKTSLECSQTSSELILPHPSKHSTEKGLPCDVLPDSKCQVKSDFSMASQNQFGNKLEDKPQTTAKCIRDKVRQGSIQANAAHLHGNEKYKFKMKSKPPEFLLNATTLEQGLEHETAEKVFPCDSSEIKYSHVMKSSPHRSVSAHHQEESEISDREAFLLGEECENEKPGDALQTKRHSPYEDGGIERGMLSSVKPVVDESCESNEVEPKDQLKKEQLRRCIAEMETKTLEGLRHPIWPVINVCYQNR